MAVFLPSATCLAPVSVAHFLTVPQVESNSIAWVFGERFVGPLLRHIYRGFCSLDRSISLIPGAYAKVDEVSRRVIEDDACLPVTSIDDADELRQFLKEKGFKHSIDRYGSFVFSLEEPYAHNTVSSTFFVGKQRVDVRLQTHEYAVYVSTDKTHVEIATPKFQARVPFSLFTELMPPPPTTVSERPEPPIKSFDNQRITEPVRLLRSLLTVQATKTVFDAQIESYESITLHDSIAEDTVKVRVPLYGKVMIDLKGSVLKGNLIIEDHVLTIGHAQLGDHHVSGYPPTFNYPKTDLRGRPSEGAWGRINGVMHTFRDGEYIAGVEAIITGGTIEGDIIFHGCKGRAILKDGAIVDGS